MLWRQGVQNFLREGRKKRSFMLDRADEDVSIFGSKVGVLFHRGVLLEQTFFRGVLF